MKIKNIGIFKYESKKFALNFELKTKSKTYIPFFIKDN